MDLDNDGDDDLLSGSYSRQSQPMAGLFQVLWRQDDGTFQKAEELKGTDGEPLIIPADEQTITENICTRPTAVDWDGDGDLDLVVGNFAGSFYVFTGEGKGRFLPEPKKLMAGDAPLKIDGVHSDPFPVDWDGDGDLDLLSGSSSGGVRWAENTAGAKAEPELKPFRTLIEPGPQIPYGQPVTEDELTGPTGSTRVWVDDVNGDGKLDILVGDSLTLISLPEGVDKEEFEQKQKQWQEDLTKASQDYQAASEDEEKRKAALEKLQNLYSQRTEFIVEDRTGFVWLYLQK